MGSGRGPTLWAQFGLERYKCKSGELVEKQSMWTWFLFYEAHDFRRVWLRNNIKPYEDVQNCCCIVVFQKQNVDHSPLALSCSSSNPLNSSSTYHSSNLPLFF